MTDEILRLLLAADHPSAREAPPRFDRGHAMRRVRALVPAVERIVGRKLEVDEHVQDASHFTDIACHRQVSATVMVPIIRIVFSSFGDLFTIVFAEELDPATTDQVVTVVTHAGFTFVPYDELEEPYTGSNPHLAGTTWFTRFFCYL